MCGAALTGEQIVRTAGDSHPKDEGHEENDELERIAGSRRQTREAIVILKAALEESGANGCDYAVLHNTENTLIGLCSDTSRKTKIRGFLNNNPFTCGSVNVIVWYSTVETHRPYSLFCQQKCP